ncbi:hypothetical protein [Thalassotalea sp. G20_0]|uniref:hypothetical protein n=1 Tax=Thalassotalea sp. G20_0 TaxID=2821093 RepID=UPI001ADADFA3|nr:hypothetical protein [Thalassotalea sp. G20_0]
MQTMSSLAISDAVLAFACLFAVFLMAQQKSFADVHRFSATAALLGFLLMALASITGSVRYGISSAWSGPHDMLVNAAMFLAPPLTGIATCLGVSVSSWSRAAWGRLILGVCVVYEVCRWYGLDIIYRDLQMAVLLIFASFLLLRSSVESGPKWLIIASVTSYFTGALIIGTEGTLAGYLRLDLFRYLIGLGNLLLSSGLYLLFKNRYQNDKQLSA